MKTNIGNATLGLAAGSMMALLAHAASETAADYSAALPLVTRAGEAMHRVELPLSVYAGVQYADLRDVRVFNGAGELVPFALAGDRPAPPPPGNTFTPPLFPVWGEVGKAPNQLDVRIEQRDDGSVVSIKTQGLKGVPGSKGAKGKARAPVERYVVAYIIDASKIDSPIAAMTPQWRAVPDNYVGTVRIEAGEDLKEWRPLLSGAPLAFLSQGGARLVQDSYRFAPVRAKYFRIILSPRAPEMVALNADGPSTQPETRRQSLRVPGRAGTNPGEIEFDLGLRAPVDRIRIVVPQPNALSPLRLDVRPDPRGEWRPVVSTVAYRIVRDGNELTSPAVPIAPNPSPRWRAIVDQTSGGFGSALPELEASWPVRNLVFLARGEGPFLLAFGRQDAQPAQLPLSTLIPGYRDGAETAFPLAETGALRSAPPPAPSSLPQFIGDADPKKLGLWAALIIGALVLALMAWRLSRQLQDGAAKRADDAAQTPPGA
ncbi:MAG: DUF3999 domain-containing protein [Betaproteobacteria bacterium]